MIERLFLQNTLAKRDLHFRFMKISQKKTKIMNKNHYKLSSNTLFILLRLARVELLKAYIFELGKNRHYLGNHKI